MDNQRKQEAERLAVELSCRISKGFYLHGVNEDGIGQCDAKIMADRIVALLRPMDQDEKWLDTCFQGMSKGGSFTHEGVKALMREAIQYARSSGDPTQADLIAARAIADDKRVFGRHTTPFTEGNDDNHPLVQAALIGILRGRGSHE